MTGRTKEELAGVTEAEKIAKDQERGDRLGDNGSRCHARDAHMEEGYKNVVENDIGDTGYGKIDKGAA